MKTLLIIMFCFILFSAELPQVEGLCHALACKKYCASKGANTGKCVPGSPNGSCLCFGYY